MGRASAPTAPHQLNLVGEDTVFEGTLRTPHDVRISGRVIGTLHVQGRVIIAAEGVVEGEVHAGNADIAGRVQGDLVIKETLLLKETARVEGRIQTGRLVVEAGAIFDGECRMGQVDQVVDTKAPASADKERTARVRKATPSEKTGEPTPGA
ncbi:MAG: polymer-forming cytoskeletal protein [Rhodothermus sp.]|nr:polymer-forming cytoskeletal protein [Rhodothermus sp.]